MASRTYQPAERVGLPHRFEISVIHINSSDETPDLGTALAARDDATLLLPRETQQCVLYARNWATDECCTSELGYMLFKDGEFSGEGLAGTVDALECEGGSVPMVASRFGLH